MKQLVFSAAIISAMFLLSSGASGVTYINETFEDDTIGLGPSDPAQKSTNQVKVAAGTGAIGTDNVAHFNDVNSGVTGVLEYNVGASNTVGNLYVQFDLLNNAPVDTGTAANPIIFGVGPWSDSTSSRLGANANRAFSIEFYQSGATLTLRVRSNSTALVQTTYDMLALQTAKIWANDNDSTGISYIRPDTLATATLAPNSFVVYINDVLLPGFTDSGFGMNVSGVGSTVGDATLGRVGFNTTTTALANFLIDNILVTDITVIPEASSAALLLGGCLLLGWFARRRLICH
jgi:hypothetical protein